MDSYRWVLPYMYHINSNCVYSCIEKALMQLRLLLQCKLINPTEKLAYQLKSRNS